MESARGIPDICEVGSHHEVARSNFELTMILTSLDQTTRIHGAIPTSSETIETTVWHEIARPQVHGYDLIAAAFLDPLRFVSIADEKVARVFEAPREFVEIVNNLRIAQLDSGVSSSLPPVSLRLPDDQLCRKHDLVQRLFHPSACRIKR